MINFITNILQITFVRLLLLMSLPMPAIPAGIGRKTYIKASAYSHQFFPSYQSTPPTHSVFTQLLKEVAVFVGCAATGYPDVAVFELVQATRTESA